MTVLIKLLVSELLQTKFKKKKKLSTEQSLYKT